MARIEAEEVEKRVRELVKPILEEKGLELYDVEWLSGRESRLRVVIQGIGGITLNDCQEVSKELSYLLDVEDFIHTGYLLEVSSPGLTRSLKKPEHYMKSRGERVRVTLRTEKGEKKSVLEGTIEEADESGFILTTDEGTERLPYDKVAKAKLQIGD
jgi:ribosome maturation factor RimP